MPDTPETSNDARHEIARILQQRQSRTPSSATPEVSELVEEAQQLRAACDEGVKRGIMPDYCDACAKLAHMAPKLLTALETLEERVRERAETVEQVISAWAFAHDIDGAARNDLFHRLHAALLKQLSGDGV